MPTSTRTAITLVGSVLLLALITGCSAGSEVKDPNDLTPPDGMPSAGSTDGDSGGNAGDHSRGEATFSVDGRSFTADLTLCSIDETDILLGGHAREVGGDATGYLGGDSTMLGSDMHAEFRIDIGADGPFQSTDDFIAIGNSRGGSEISLSQEGAGHLVTAEAWNARGDDLGEGSVAFVCA